MLDKVLNNDKKNKKTSKFRSRSSVKQPETVWRIMGKSQHYPKYQIPVESEWKQNRGAVTVWDLPFSCLFVYVRGTIGELKHLYVIYISAEFFACNHCWETIVHIPQEFAFRLTTQLEGEKLTLPM